MMKCFLTAAGAAAVAFAAPAHAEDVGSPFPVADGVTFDPMLAARLRYELVDQAGAANDADALTFRFRLGGELKTGDFSALAEAEGTAPLTRRYNDTLPQNGVEPYPTVADPQNFELNRAQLSYMHDGTGLTVGRQRIILDNARFVGNVGWRQNEQTFDAMRAQAKFGPVTLDATYADSQRTVFGVDSPNGHFDGDFVLLNGGLKLPVVEAKAFAYLIDYDARIAFSSQSYGVLIKAAVPLPGVKLNATASYATQSDYGANPVSYRADYLNLELGATMLGFGLTGGYEKLGSDRGIAAFQTPLATLHAFNGWADMFLTTPANGLRDYYAGISRKIAVPFLPSFKADLAYHRFDSDFGDLRYGSEWDASVGFKLGPVALLAKYADYDADKVAVDTRKFWLQAEYGF